MIGNYTWTTLILQEAKTARDSAKTLASEYLAGKYTRLTDPFQMAITAYALNLANHREKDNAFSKLKTMRLESMYNESKRYANESLL